MSDINNATHPETNFVVHAAAGTGKTWLLTSRIIRLLLSGAQPGGILAITFTRKAAAEIEQRVMQRLFDMAICAPSTLKKNLLEIGCEPSIISMEGARFLYESLLVAEHPLKVTTFHAFCQDLLQRFPLESGLAPGFRIVENTRQLQERAWQIFESSLRRPDYKAVHSSFESLLHLTGSPVMARNALLDFLEQRSDWWSYVEGELKPVNFAKKQFDRLMNTNTASDSDGTISLDTLRKNIYRYRELLLTNATKTIADRLQQIQHNALATESDFVALNRAKGVFRDSKNQHRVFANNKANLKKLGEKDLNEACDLEKLVQQQLDGLLENEKRLKNRELNYAWFHCGQKLLSVYQQLKKQMEVLDFADLEWQASLLLNQNEFAHWVQFKLDQRIDHLLIDEFQDTNPTQWHLIHPLLVEMASGQSERARSAFIVGDVKQSIYRFRRAAPELFRHAKNWLVDNMGAESASQRKSYRSSPAIIEFVNLIFGHQSNSNTDTSPKAHLLLNDFSTHEAHHQKRWGKVELLPLVTREKATASNDYTGFRNPLKHPRRQDVKVSENQHRQEANLIINQIKILMGTAVDDDGTPRQIHYGDIMILVRSRTHTATYETELRRAGIPFLSASKDQFLAALEIKDLVNLLQALIKPFDNLALASALRSPIFSCTNETLIALAQLPHQWWWQRLQHLAGTTDCSDSVKRAVRLLGQWRELVDRIPVHDLLDRIFAQSNLINRYLAGVPDQIRPRIESNLTHLLELTLEMDSGRYPSLNQFLNSLTYLGEDNSPATTTVHGQQVRIMTIHGAKGLEAPVVFLADMARADRENPASHRTISHWPDDARKPETFLLTGKKDERDSISDAVYRAERDADKREEANLLYVALTRARQYLFISGCEPNSKEHGWYGFILSRLNDEKLTLKNGIAGINIQYGTKENSSTSPLTFSFGQPSPLANVPKSTKSKFIKIEAALKKPIVAQMPNKIINPSYEKEMDYEISHGDTGHSDTARNRGIWLHRILQQITESGDLAAAKKRLKREAHFGLENAEFEKYWQQCLRLTQDDLLQPIFQLRNGAQARNEMPVLYRHEGKSVFGIIDRIVIEKKRILIIDYKSHEAATAENIGKLAEQFYPQMRYYGAGASKLWPGKKIVLLLLFTACAETIEVPYPSAA